MRGPIWKRRNGRCRLGRCNTGSGGRLLHAAAADNTLMPSTLHRKGGQGEAGATRGTGAIRKGKMGKVRSFALLNANNFIDVQYALGAHINDRFLVRFSN